MTCGAAACLHSLRGRCTVPLAILRNDLKESTIFVTDEGFQSPEDETLQTAQHRTCDLSLTIRLTPRKRTFETSTSSWEPSRPYETYSSTYTYALKPKSIYCLGKVTKSIHRQTMYQIGHFINLLNNASLPTIK